MGSHPPRDLDPKIKQLIRIKVRRLTGNYGFNKDDEEDLRQELSMHIVKAMPKHDPRRASAATFAERIVNSKITSIIEGATAQKRGRHKERPIESVPEDAFLKTDDIGDQPDISIDLRAAVAALPPELRQIAVLFMELGNEAAVIRQIGLSRQKVRGLCQRIRRCLREKGLGPNLED